MARNFWSPGEQMVRQRSNAMEFISQEADHEDSQFQHGREALGHQRDDTGRMEQAANDFSSDPHARNEASTGRPEAPTGSPT